MDMNQKRYKFDDMKPPSQLNRVNSFGVLFSFHFIAPYLLGINTIILFKTLYNYLYPMNDIKQERLTYIYGILSMSMSFIIYLLFSLFFDTLLINIPLYKEYNDIVSYGRSTNIGHADLMSIFAIFLFWFSKLCYYAALCFNIYNFKSKNKLYFGLCSTLVLWIIGMIVMTIDCTGHDNAYEIGYISEYNILFVNQSDTQTPIEKEIVGVMLILTDFIWFIVLIYQYYINAKSDGKYIRSFIGLIVSSLTFWILIGLFSIPKLRDVAAIVTPLYMFIFIIDDIVIMMCFDENIIVYNVLCKPMKYIVKCCCKLDEYNYESINHVESELTATSTDKGI